MTCVNQETGVVGNFTFKNFYAVVCLIISLWWSNYQVEPSLFPMLATWQREHTMEDILTQLKKEMMSPQNRKLAQPPEGLLILFLVIDRNSVFFLSLQDCQKKIKGKIVFVESMLCQLIFCQPGLLSEWVVRKLDCCKSSWRLDGLNLLIAVVVIRWCNWFHVSVESWYTCLNSLYFL